MILRSGKQKSFFFCAVIEMYGACGPNYLHGSTALLQSKVNSVREEHKSISFHRECNLTTHGYFPSHPNILFQAPLPTRNIRGILLNHI